MGPRDQAARPGDETAQALHGLAQAKALPIRYRTSAFGCPFSSRFLRAGEMGGQSTQSVIAKARYVLLCSRGRKKATASPASLGRDAAPDARPPLPRRGGRPKAFR